jgi:hypothetical protein
LRAERLGGVLQVSRVNGFCVTLRMKAI